MTRSPTSAVRSPASARACRPARACRHPRHRAATSVPHTSPPPRRCRSALRTRSATRASRTVTWATTRAARPRWRPRSRCCAAPATRSRRHVVSRGSGARAARVHHGLVAARASLALMRKSSAQVCRPLLGRSRRWISGFDVTAPESHDMIREVNYGRTHGRAVGDADGIHGRRASRVVAAVGARGRPCR